MNSYKKICFLALIFLLAFANAFAQKKKTPPKKQTVTPAQKTADARLKPPADRKFNHPFELTADYDRFEDKTIVTLRIPINSMETMYFHFSFDGERIKQPPKTILFQYFGNSSKFTYTVDNFVVLTDRDRFRVKLVQLPVLDNGKLPFMGVFDYATFLRIANGETVEMKIGETVMFFDEQSLEAIKDFASRTNPNVNRDSEISQNKAIEKEVKAEISKLMRLTPRVKTEIKLKLEKIDIFQQGVKKAIAGEGDDEYVGLVAQLAAEVLDDVRTLPDGLLKTIITDCVSDTSAAFIIYETRAGKFDKNSANYKSILETAVKKYKLDDYPENEQPGILMSKASESFSYALNIASAAKIVELE